MPYSVKLLNCIPDIYDIILDGHADSSDDEIILVELDNEKGSGLKEEMRGLDASRIDEHGVEIEIQQSPDRLMGEADVEEKEEGDMNGDADMRSTQERSFGGLESEGENLQLLVKSFVIIV